MQLKLDQVIFNNTPFLANANYTSEWIYVGDYTLGSIQLSYEADSTTINGDFTLEASCDPIGTVPAVLDTVADSTVAVTAAASGTVFWNTFDIGFNWLRVKFTFDTTSDLGVINGRSVFKGQN